MWYNVLFFFLNKEFFIITSKFVVSYMPIVALETVF